MSSVVVADSPISNTAAATPPSSSASKPVKKQAIPSEKAAQKGEKPSQNAAKEGGASSVTALSEAAQAAKRENARLKRQQKALSKRQEKERQLAEAAAVAGQASSAVSESASSSSKALMSRPSDAVPDLTASISSSSGSSSSAATLVSSSRPVSRAMTSNTSVRGGEGVQTSKLAIEEQDKLDDLGHVEDWAAEEVSILLSSGSNNHCKSEINATTAISVEPSSTLKASKKAKNKQKKLADAAAVEGSLKKEDTPAPAVALQQEQVAASEAKLALKKQKQAAKNQKKREKKAALLKQGQEQEQPAEKAASQAALAQHKPAEAVAQIAGPQQSKADSQPVASTSKPVHALVGSAASRFATQPQKPQTITSKPTLPSTTRSPSSPDYVTSPWYTGPSSLLWLYNEPGSRTFVHQQRNSEELAMRVSLKPIPSYRETTLEGMARRKLRNKYGVKEIVLRRNIGQPVDTERVLAAPLEEKPGVRLSGKGKAKETLQEASLPKPVSASSGRVASEQPAQVPAFVSALDRKVSTSATPAQLNLPPLSRSQLSQHQKASSTTSTAPSTSVPTPPPSTSSAQQVRPVVIGETTFYTSSPSMGITALDDPAVISSGTPRKSGFIPASEVTQQQQPQQVEQTASTAVIEHSERYNSEAEKASELFMQRFVPEYREPTRPAQADMYQPMLPYGYEAPMPMYQPQLPQQAFYGPDGQLYIYNDYRPISYPQYYPTAPLTKFIRSNVQPYDSPPISPHQPRPVSYAMSSTSSTSAPAHALQQVTSNGTTYFLPAVPAGGGAEMYQQQQGYQGPVRDLEEYVQYGYPMHEGGMMMQQEQY